MHKLYDKFVLNGKRGEDYQCILDSNNYLTQLITNSKLQYYNRLTSKLLDNKTPSKAYWTILKSVFSNRKIPKIPPLFVGDDVVSDFKEKATLFNSYFAKQCSILENNSEVPDEINPSLFSLSSIDMDDGKLLSLFRSLDITMSHGHDGISARMIKMCDTSIDDH